MINILLCDDEEKTLDRIRTYIYSIRSQIKYPIDITEYTSADFDLWSGKVHDYKNHVVE